MLFRSFAWIDFRTGKKFRPVFQYFKSCPFSKKRLNALCVFDIVGKIIIWEIMMNIFYFLYKLPNRSLNINSSMHIWLYFLRVYLLSFTPRFLSHLFIFSVSNSVIINSCPREAASKNILLLLRTPSSILFLLYVIDFIKSGIPHLVVLSESLTVKRRSSEYLNVPNCFPLNMIFLSCFMYSSFFLLA